MKDKQLFSGLFFINFCITLGFGVLDSFFSLYVISTGVREVMLGIPFAFYAVTKIFFSVPLGALSDKIGRKRVLSFAIITYSFVSVSYLFYPGLEAAVILRVIQGGACAMFRPVMLSYIGDMTESGKRSTVTGTFDISFYGALGAGPVLGGFIRNYYGFNGVFVFLSLLCFISLLVTLFYIKDTGQYTGNQSEGMNGLPVSALSRNTKALLVFIFGRACGISAIAAFMPVYFEKNLHFSSLETGFVLSVSMVFMTVCLRPLGKLGDVVPRSFLVVLGGFAVAVTYLFLPFAVNFTDVVFICIFTGVFGALSQPSSTALLLDEGGKAGMGRTFGYFNLFMNAGFAFGALTGSVLSGIFGVNAVFCFAGVVGILSTAVFCLHQTDTATVNAGAATFKEGARNNDI